MVRSYLFSLLILLGTPLLGQAQQMMPQFTGLQPMDVSQYVDPTTGDFNFQSLLLEIPGSQGSYPLLLTYQAGIGLNQSASWVGLGFNFEPGALYRSISQVPDDYRRNKITVKEYDPGFEQRADIPNLFEQLQQAAADAHQRVARDMKNSVMSGRPSANKMFENVGELGIAYGQLVSAVNLPSAFIDPIGFTFNSILLFTTYPKMGNANISSWDYNFVDEVDKEKFLFFTTDKDSVTKWWLDKTTDQNAYGFLYEHDKITYLTDGNQGYFSPAAFADGSTPELYSYNNPAVLDGNRSYDSANITSDYYQLVDGERFENMAPAFSAPDAYVVASPLLSGELMPVRFDNVSLSSSNISNRYHDQRIATYTYALPTTKRSQRPQFLFSEQSNHFSFFSDVFQQENQGLQYDNKEWSGSMIKTLDFPAQASSLTQDIPAREGYDGAGTLKQAVQVDWFTNEEINAGTAYQQGFVDYTADRARGFTDVADSPTESPFPPKGIGGFTVTDKNGMRFHFALPIYEKEMVYHSAFFVETTETMYESTTTYTHPYAKKWLLTAITGPDFVDDGSLPGTIDNFDHGYYVKFDYGKYSSDSYWRSPHQGTDYVPDDETVELYSEGQEQQYFLNTVSTNTHTALFVKERRRDHLTSATGATGDWLALKEIILLSNEDYRQLWDAKGGQWDTVTEYNGDYSANVLKYEDIYAHDAIDSLVQHTALRKVVFNHNYSLARQSPTSAQGRLTLQGIELFGKQTTPVMQGFAFDYGFNPDYHPLSYDAWGLYKDNQERGQESHLVGDAQPGQAWSLTGITTPNQQQINVTYERDTYGAVAQFSTDSLKLGGNLRVKAIEQRDLVSNIRDRYEYTYRNGVTSSEPAFALGEDYDLLSVYRYPQARVTYQEVEKKRTNGGGFLFKEVTSFGVMDSTTIQLDTLQFNPSVVIAPDDSVLMPFPPFNRLYYYGQQLNEAVYHTQYRTDRIGQPQHQLVYDANDQLLQETSFQYEDSPLGRRSQAAHLLDHTFRNYTKVPTESNQFDTRMTYRFVNTVSSYIPQRLVSVTSVDHTTATRTQSRFLAHDFYTGEPLKTVSDDAYGQRWLQEKVPAFRVGAYTNAMGLALDGGTNQLSVPAAQYTYRLDAGQPLDSLTEEDLVPIGLGGATAQRWGAFGQTVYRPQSQYAWVGSETLAPDGTYPYADFASQPFTWGESPPPAAWEEQSKVLAYNLNSIAMLTEDINNHQLASLTDPEGERVTASVAHADTAEIAYSGAEYYARFGDTEGRVQQGGGIPSEARAHTGHYSLLLPSGSEGFEVTLKNSEGADLSRTYRASVWVYMPGSLESPGEMEYVELFYSINGTEQTAKTPVYQEDKSKSWYRLVLDIPPTAGANTLTVACRNDALRAIYLDDFRLHPLEATMTSFAYDRASDEVTHVLDADNFYVQYEYDELGNRIETKREFYYPVDHVLNRNRIHYATPNQ
ncbi:hypothetical protein [Tunicatimonas pelagia]|uniref:hypothetical protein n=1 Tax=Tunicatimonas pelagia TaxID=931531 RepID=UPI002665E8C3|nr:hypothetical protein [Tunicatimonas pelagia]WKN44221.1 hypothetical protein P0M28_04470 [Tunicatimonas pelagia]